MSFQLQKGEEFYRLVAPSGEEGELVEYGEPATVLVGGDLYLAYCDIDDEDDEDAEADELLEDKVFKCVPVQADVTEGVEFRDEEGNLIVAEDDDADDGNGDDDDDDSRIFDSGHNDEFPAA